MSDYINKFGKGIPYREGNPIQLLKYINNEYGKIVLNDEAINIINSIEEPISVIVVVGSYRRGKSWFANLLLGRHNGFLLGSTVDGCTQGIYMWDQPFYHEGKRIIVLDCEGIDDPKQNQQWAIRLFVLCLTISSTFIYNLNGVVGREDIGKLFLMSHLTKYIQPPPDYQFLPRMVVLLRDFMLQNPDDFRDYFLNRLSQVNEQAAEGIKKYFSHFDVFALPMPASDRTQLQNLDKVSTSDLQSEFVEEATISINKILSTSAPKYIGSSTMSGVPFTKFLQECVNKLNDTSETSNFHLSIPDEYESIIEYIAHKTIDHCVQMYVTSMKFLLRSGNDNDENVQHVEVFNWTDFHEIHLNVFNQVETEFFKRIIGDEIQIKNYERDLNKLIGREFEEFRRINSESLYELNIELAKELWDRNVKVGLDKDNRFESHEDFDNAIAVFEREVLDTLIDCPETEKIMARFKSQEYQDAITILKSLGILKGELADQIKSMQETEQRYLECASEEKELQIKYDKLKSEHEQVELRLKNKIRELDENLERQNVTNVELLQQIQNNRDESLTMLLSEKESELEATKKKIEEIKRSREHWIRIIGTLTPIIQIGFKIVGSIFLSQYKNPPSTASTKPQEYPVTLHNSTLNGQLLTSLLPWQTISYLQYFRHSGRFTFRYEGISKLESLNDLLVHLSRNRNEYLISGNTMKNPGSVYRFKLPTICLICHEVGHEPESCNVIDIILSRRMLNHQEIDVMINRILEFNRPIRKISLRFNQVGNEGAKSIAKLIEQNNSLTELNLGDTKINDDGILLIVDALKKNRSIKKLILENNDIGDKGLSAIADLLKINKVLKNIDLSQLNSEVSLEFLKKLDEALLHNTNLVYVNFNTKGLHLQPGVNFSKFDSLYLLKSSHRVSIPAHLDGRKIQLYSSILNYFHQNRIFDSFSTVSIIELMSKARILLLNNLNSNVLVKVPSEVWIQIFRDFGEEKGLSKRHVDMIVKYSSTRSTLSKDVTKRKFLESVYTNNFVLE
ncbi:10038_t:CDS:2 [Funneliformis mosseae]|uniref:10038_t:CDS:1 n=1 Tax=Funneliformis mosseae TaxID=27381 RepID=A0A9N8UY90_FUNMO|nr:10038_t:CDS:2 [Funneliformis mosseae]